MPWLWLLCQALFFSANPIMGFIKNIQSQACLPPFKHQHAAAFCTCRPAVCAGRPAVCACRPAVCAYRSAACAGKCAVCACRLASSSQAIYWLSRSSERGRRESCRVYEGAEQFRLIILEMISQDCLCPLIHVLQLFKLCLSQLNLSMQLDRIQQGLLQGKR